MNNNLNVFNNLDMQKKMFNEEEQMNNNLNKHIPEINQLYSCGPEQRSINVRSNVVNFDYKNLNKNNQFDNNNLDNLCKINNYQLGPDPNNVNQMDYLKNLLEKTKLEIDNLNNNIDDDTSKTFSIYK